MYKDRQKHLLCIKIPFFSVQHMTMVASVHNLMYKRHDKLPLYIKPRQIMYKSNRKGELYINASTRDS